MGFYSEPPKNEKKGEKETIGVDFCTCPVDPDGLGAIFGASFGQFLNVLAGGKADPIFQIFGGHFRAKTSAM